MRHFVSVRDYCGDFEPICLVKKKTKCVVARQEQEREQDRGNGTIMLQKNNLRKRNFAERR